MHSKTHLPCPSFKAASSKDRNSSIKNASIALLLLLLAALALSSAYAVPSGPTIVFIANETKQPSGATIINTTGGSITTVYLNATTQNLRWKGYVGNVSGSLTLDDASDNTLFDWTLTDINGQIYATRYSGSINWSGVNCSNSTHVSLESIALNHTSKDDNISSTFSTQTHREFYVGTKQILQNTCYSVHTYVNSTAQSSLFEEVILYDGTNSSNGNTIFATPLEQNRYGFDNATYDFQMILPEVALPTWTSSTAYYFYAELT
jgi:hypothetical protein